MKTIKQFVFLAFFALLPITTAYAQQQLIVRNSETGESFDVEISGDLTITADEWTDSIKVYRERARHGDVQAYEKLAWCYKYGVGVEKDFLNVLCMCQLANERSEKSLLYFLMQSQMNNQMENTSIEAQYNDSISVSKMYDQIVYEWPSFRLLIKACYVTSKDELQRIFEPEAVKGDKLAKLVLASLAADSICSDASINNLEKIATHTPMIYNKLGRIYMGQPDPKRMNINRAIDCFKKADEYGMLSKKSAKRLLECYQIKMKEGENLCDETELSRLRRLSGHQEVAETE